MASILSSILAAIVAAITSAIRQKRLDKERIDDAKQAAVLEVQNAKLHDVREAEARAEAVRAPTAADLVKRLQSGKF